MGDYNNHPCDSAIFPSVYIYIGRRIQDWEEGFRMFVLLVTMALVEMRWELDQIL